MVILLIYSFFNKSIELIAASPHCRIVFVVFRKICNFSDLQI